MKSLLLSAAPREEGGGQGQECWGVRGSCGLAFSQSSQILYFLAIQLISCFHNLGLDLYICDLYIMLIIERYEINGVIQITKKRKMGLNV